MRPGGARNPQAIVLVALLILTWLTWLPRGRGGIDLRLDSGVYYVLGTSLGQGNGYRLLNEPGNIQAVQYPPLVPGLIALDEVSLGTGDALALATSLKHVWFAFFLLFIALSYCYLASFLTWGWALAGAVVCMLNAQLCFYSNQCSAEIPFALISIAFVLLYRTGRFAEAPAALLALAAFFCRTIGIALLGAWIIDALFRRQFRRAAVRSAVTALCVLSWGAYVRSIEKSPEYNRPHYAYQRAAYLFYNVSYAKNIEYKDPFRPELGKASARDKLLRFSENVLAVPAALGEAATTYKALWVQFFSTIDRRIGLALLGSSSASLSLVIIGSLVLIGAFLLLRRQEWLPVFYVLLTLFAACCAPWQQISRYLVPICPLLVLAMFEALKSIRSWCQTAFRAQWTAPVLSAVMYAGLAFLVAQEGLSYSATCRYSKPESYYDSRGGFVRFPQFLYRDQDVDLEHAAQWIKAHSERSDVIAAAMPQWTYIRTGLKTVMPPLEQDPRKANALLNSVPIRYLIVESDSKMGNLVLDHVLPVVRTFPQNWSVVYTTPDRAVLVFERTGQSSISKNARMRVASPRS